MSRAEGKRPADSFRHNRFLTNNYFIRGYGITVFDLEFKYKLPRPMGILACAINPEPATCGPPN